MEYSEIHYKMDSLDELMEYMWLKPKFTGLKVDLFADDGGSYLRHKHKLLLFVRNGYNKTVEEFIPISISDDPKILDDTIDLMISEEDIFDIQDFIVSNFKDLKALADREISQTEFVERITKST